MDQNCRRRLVNSVHHGFDIINCKGLSSLAAPNTKGITNIAAFILILHVTDVSF